MMRWALLVLAGCLSTPDAPAGPERKWQLRDGSHEPGALVGPRLAYDTDRAQVILYGGASLDGTNGVVFLLEPTGWFPICTLGSSIPPRFGGGLAYDPVRHRLLSVGGATDRTATTVTDTVGYCETATSTWAPLPPLPSPRAFGQLVAEPTGDLVLIGGVDGNRQNLMDALRSTDGGVTWTSIGATPVAVGSQGMTATYDPEHQRVLVVRDDPAADLAGATGTYFDELWELRDTTWTKICDGCSGGARIATSLVHAAGLTFEIGGYDSLGGTTLSATSVLDNGRWVEFSNQPGPRDSVGVAYDEARDVVVLYGGNGRSCQADDRGDCNETWELVADTIAP